MQFYALGGLGCRAAASSEPRLAAHLLAASENIRAESELACSFLSARLRTTSAAS